MYTLAQQQLMMQITMAITTSKIISFLLSWINLQILSGLSVYGWHCNWTSSVSGSIIHLLCSSLAGAQQCDLHCIYHTHSFPSSNLSLFARFKNGESTSEFYPEMLEAFVKDANKNIVIKDFIFNFYLKIIKKRNELTLNIEIWIRFSTEREWKIIIKIILIC